MSYLDLTKKLAATVAKRQRTIEAETPTFQVEAGRLTAAKLTGTVVGTIWLVLDTETLAENPDIIRSGLPVFFFDEVEGLRGKTPEELKAVAAVKGQYPTSRVLQ